MRRRPSLLLLLPAALAAAVAGCSGPETAENQPATTAVAVSPMGTAYNSVEELATTLTESGLVCVLEYPGLRDDMTDAELSICTVDGDQAYLRVWTRPDAIQSFLANTDSQGGTVAVGANWTASLTDPATAQRVAAALGGLVPTADTATSAPATAAP